MAKKGAVDAVQDYLEGHGVSCRTVTESGQTIVAELVSQGEEKLSIPGNSELFLRDICDEDACLELLVGEPVMRKIGFRWDTR